MSAQFSTFAIDLEDVRKAVGSKRRSLLPALRGRFGPWFENVNEQLADSERGPPLEEVLRLLIAGKPIDPDWSFQFAVAIELLYRHFGVELPARHFETMRIGWAEHQHKGRRGYLPLAVHTPQERVYQLGSPEPRKAG